MSGGSNGGGGCNADGGVSSRALEVLLAVCRADEEGLTDVKEYTGGLAAYLVFVAACCAPTSPLSGFWILIRCQHPAASWSTSKAIGQCSASRTALSKHTGQVNSGSLLLCITTV